MSTDFTTGKNKKIEKDSLIMMSCDVLSKVLSASRDELYNFYSSKGICKGNGIWDYFDRYTTEFKMNNYTNNKFDDLIILSAAVDKPEFLNKSKDSINERKNKIKELCNPLINDGRCNNFNNKLTGTIPHLDTPDEITSLSAKIGSVPCVENGYETFTPIITYTDSCGCNIQAPVPQYPLDYSGNKMQRAANDIEYLAEGQEVNWEITSNNDQIIISNDTISMKENELTIATLSTATLENFSLDVTYKED